MRRWPFAVLALLAATAIAAEGQQILSQVGPSVLTVTVLDERGKVDGQGSGVVIAKDRAVTNCHVLLESHSVKVRIGDRDLVARWLQADLPRDLCLLEVPELGATPVKLRKSETLTMGERVFAVGNPLGFGVALSEGLISNIKQAQGERRIYTSAALSPGSSGGGLFDSEGRLVGITTAAMYAGQNLNVAIPADWIDELARRGAAPPAVAEIPPPEPRWGTDAEALMAKRDWAALEDLAQRWANAQPKSPTAWRILGVAQAYLGKFAEAEKSQRASLALHPKNVVARVDLAEALYRLGRKDECEAALQQAVASNPSSSYPYQLRAKLLYQQNRFDEAKKFAVEAVRLGSGDVHAWWWLGDIEEKRGNPEAASRAFRIALRHMPNEPALIASLARTSAAAGNYDQAHDVLNQSNGTAKMNAADWNNLGVAEHSRKRYTDAENAYRKALELEPRSNAAWTNLALVQLATGRQQAADVSLEEALRIQPDDVKALYLRAERRFRERDYPTARAMLEHAVALDPNNAAGWRLLGDVRFEMNDFVGAVEAYRRRVALPDPKGPDWLSLGNAEVMAGSFSEAEVALQNAERLTPNDNQTLLALGALYGKRGDNRRAAEYFDRVVANDPSSVRGWSNKGYSLIQLGRYDEAVKALETAVLLQPDFANAWINLGQALLLQKQIGKAIQALERATNLAPNAADARLYLAQSYFASRQLPQARMSLDKLAALQPDSPQALGLATMLNLAEGKSEEAKSSFRILKLRSPSAANALRVQAIANGLPGAAMLPE